MLLGALRSISVTEGERGVLIDLWAAQQYNARSDTKLFLRSVAELSLARGGHLCYAAKVRELINRRKLTLFAVSEMD